MNRWCWITEFERSLAKAFNQFFETRNDVDGISHRKKQHRFSSQLCDLLVDSLDPSFYLAIENKSVKTESTNKVYFSQHFSTTDEGHQVERITEFIERSGRTGYLAIEFKRGTGRPRRGFLLSWETVLELYRDDGEAGIPLDLIREQAIELERSGGEYSIRPFVDQL